MTSSPRPLTPREAFCESVIHDRRRLLGRELQPFCLDHWTLLDAYESPLIHGGRIEIDDMQVAIKVCSTATCFEFYDAALRPNFGWKMWNKLTEKFPVEPLLGAFNEYVFDYWPKFSRWYFSDDEESKCPGLFIAAARLVDKGHDPVKVRRMGLGELMAWNLASDESKGDPLKRLKSNQEVIGGREEASDV